MASATPEQSETEEPPTPSEPGTEQSIEPEQPSGNRAIMVVTMKTVLEVEFDLSMKEVNAFISWYEAKQAEAKLRMPSISMRITKVRSATVRITFYMIVC